MSTPALTESDLLELISLRAKAEWEGSLDYTLENWHWRFDDPELAECQPLVLRKALSVHADAIRAWWEAHPGQPGADLINAHRDRQDAARRAEASE